MQAPRTLARTCGGGVGPDPEGGPELWGLLLSQAIQLDAVEVNFAMQVQPPARHGSESMRGGRQRGRDGPGPNPGASWEQGRVRQLVDRFPEFGRRRHAEGLEGDQRRAPGPAGRLARPREPPDQSRGRRPPSGRPWRPGSDLARRGLGTQRIGLAQAVWGRAIGPVDLDHAVAPVPKSRASPAPYDPVPSMPKVVGFPYVRPHGSSGGVALGQKPESVVLNFLKDGP